MRAALNDALRCWAEVHAVDAAPDERIAVGNEIVADAQAMNDRHAEVMGHSITGVGLVIGGRMEEAKAVFERRDALAESLALPFLSRFTTHLTAAMVALHEGRWDDADRHQREVYEWGWERLGRVNALMASFILEVTGLFERGRYDEAEARAEFIRQFAPDLPHWPIAADYVTLLRGGDLTSAVDRLRRHAREGFRLLPRDGTWLLLLCYLVELAAATGETTSAAALDELFRPYAGLIVFSGQSTTGPVSFGAADRFRGLLAATLGRDSDAVALLESAVALNERTGARPQLVKSQHDLARLLAKRGDHQRAEALRRSARALAGELGMPRWTTALSGREQPRRSEASMIREGDVWTVSFDGRTTRVKDATGMRYLARLLATPGREVAAVELAAAGVEQPDAGPLIDAEAIDRYRQRILDLQEDVAEAEAAHDVARAERAQDELDVLVDELSGAVGLGGRSRRSGSTAERARSAVTKALHRTIRRLADADPDLGRYLSVTVRTGTFCSFSPDLAATVHWSVDQHSASSRQ
jgi:tetratricopeptide (TPR) repeat protein